MKKEILIVDSTLRDGSHAMKHQFTKQEITDYAKGAEKGNIKILIVGHGNGLGASSLQLGKSLLSDKEMLETAKKMEGCVFAYTQSDEISYIIRKIFIDFLKRLGQLIQNI